MKEAFVLNFSRKHCRQTTKRSDSPITKSNALSYWEVDDVDVIEVGDKLLNIIRSSSVRRMSSFAGIPPHRLRVRFVRLRSFL